MKLVIKAQVIQAKFKSEFKNRGKILRFIPADQIEVSFMSFHFNDELKIKHLRGKKQHSNSAWKKGSYDFDININRLYL